MPYFVTVSSIVIAGVKFQVQGFYSLQAGKDVRFFFFCDIYQVLLCVYLNKNEIFMYKSLAQSTLKYFSAIHQCPNPKYRITDITPNIYEAGIYVSSQYPSSSFTKCHVLPTNTVEPQYNKGPRDWQNLFAITRFRYIQVLFHIFCYYWCKENCLLYRGLRYIEVLYIEIPLKYFDYKHFALE